MRKVMLLIIIWLLVPPAAVSAEPLACKQVGPNRVVVGPNRIITLATGLEIEKISGVTCESRELQGFKFVLARYTIITGPGADGKNRAKRLYKEVFLWDDDIVSVWSDELNETGVNEPFQGVGSNSELVSYNGSVFIVGYEEKSLRDYFQAVARGKTDINYFINAFAVQRFHPGKKPCPQADESCKPRFEWEHDPVLIAGILRSLQ
jgi:hypothetical protein